MLTAEVLENDSPTAVDVRVTEDTLSVDLRDGRTLQVPLAWYPRLAHATPEERNHWRLIGQGRGIHWEDIDEDISLVGLLLGKGSGESHSSFNAWLDGYRARKNSLTYEKMGFTSGGTKTTTIGFINKHRQLCCGHRGKHGNDHGQYAYRMECLDCRHVYGANGADIFERKCPNCQGGKDGIDY